MPSVRFLAFIYLACYFKLVAVILLLNKIISIYSRYAEKGLVYITIMASFSCQPFFCTKCTKLNIYSLYNICLVFNIKYIFFIHLCAY